MIDESIPKSWLIHEVKITPSDLIDNPNDWQNTENSDDTFIIQYCRIDNSRTLTSVTEGTGGDVSAIQGNYTLFIDAKNSFPLDRLPEVDDQVEWTDGYSNYCALVKTIAPMYSDLGINHWEVTLL